MKKILITCLMTLCFFFANSQVPEGFSYQAIIRNSAGEILGNQSISLRISIVKGNEVGDIVYSELHSVITNQFGLINLVIGQGKSNDDFSALDWSNDIYFTQIELDLEGGENYVLLGVSQLLSVPYALYAKNAGNINDSDSTNEIQILSISNDTIYLENGGFVKLPEDKFIDADADSTNELQGIYMENNTLFLTKADTSINKVTLPFDKVNDADSDNMNEIQYFSVSNNGDTLFLSKSNYIIIPGVSAANPFLKQTGTFIDNRDSREYKWVRIGGQIWMAENLNVGNFITASINQTDNSIIEKYCYGNYPFLCNLYGGMYQWNEMMNYNPSDSSYIGITQGICPVGWHIPTETEWEILFDYIGGKSLAGTVLKEIGNNLWYKPIPDYDPTPPTDEYGFTALPGGQMLGDLYIFWDERTGAYFWNSTENSTTYGKIMRLYYIFDYAQYGISDKNDAMSVRCIKN